MVATTAKKRLKTNTAAHFWALLPLPGAMPTPPFEWACSMAAAKACPANSALGMPPCLGRMSARN